MNRDLGIPAPALVGEQPRDGWSEKRRHARRQLGVRCWIRDGSNTLYARVHDVSMGGLSIRAPVQFSPDADLELALVLAGDAAKPGDLAIRARGRVVWVATQLGGHGRGGAPRMGAEFLAFLDGEQALRRLIGLA